MFKGVIACLLLMLAAVGTSSYAARCADFKTQKQAQAYFVKHGDMRLDRDKDGRACDCLPGGNGKRCPGKGRRR